MKITGKRTVYNVTITVVKNLIKLIFIDIRLCVLFVNKCNISILGFIFKNHFKTRQNITETVHSSLDIDLKFRNLNLIYTIHQWVQNKPHTITIFIRLK